MKKLLYLKKLPNPVTKLFFGTLATFHVNVHKVRVRISVEKRNSIGGTFSEATVITFLF